MSLVRDRKDDPGAYGVEGRPGFLEGVGACKDSAMSGRYLGQVPSSSTFLCRCQI